MSPKPRNSKANAAVSRAIREGRMGLPPACEACGVPYRIIGTKGFASVVWHHWSYEEAHWLDVIPLCRSCHGKIHTGGMDEPRTGRRYPKRAAYAWSSFRNAVWAVGSSIRRGHNGAPFMRRADREAALRWLDGHGTNWRTVSHKSFCRLTWKIPRDQRSASCNTPQETQTP